MSLSFSAKSLSSLTPRVRSILTQMKEAITSASEIAATTIITATSTFTPDRPFNLVVLNSTAAITVTLATPTTAMNGYRVQLFNASAEENIITTAATIYDGGASTYTTITLDSTTAGAGVELMAYNGNWYVAGTNNVNYS